MMKTLRSPEEVEAELQVMRALKAPPAMERDFSNLVWEHVGRPQVKVIFQMPAPALARALAGVVLVCSLLAFQKFLLNPRDSAPAFQEVELKGLIFYENPSLQLRSPMFLGEGARIVTEHDSRAFIFFPNAGTVYVEKDSSLEIAKARQTGPQGRTHYELSLTEGAVYSRFESLKDGSAFHYVTPIGSARVLGTDFSLNFQKDEGMSLDVLTGFVELSSSSGTEAPKRIEKGRHALISSHADGTILIREMSREEETKLSGEFNQIFGGSSASEASSEAEDEGRKIKILWRKDE